MQRSAELCIERRLSGGVWDRPNFSETLLLARLSRDLVEQALHDDDANVDAGGYVGQELGDDVSDGVGEEAGEDALRGGGWVGSEAGDVLVGDDRAGDRGDEVLVVGHEAAAVGMGDADVGDGMP